MASYIVTDRIRVNIVHSFAVPPRVKCEQYDGDYTKLIQAVVYNGDVLYTIPSAVRRIVVSGLKPDNTGFSYDCTWSGNTVSFSLMRQMTVVDGKVPCNITMFDASNNQVSSAVFVLDVEKAALPSDVVVSSNDFQTFVDYVQAANLYWQYSKSYAVGNTGVREGENVDNAKYYAHLARMYKGSPLTASTISEMEDVERVYVYIGNESGYNNGHWYFYDDTAWVDGGVYNSEGIQTDKELLIEDVAADAKTVGDIIGHEPLVTEAQALRGAINELAQLKVIITPEMYGAIGDGVNDDTIAINNMLANASGTIALFTKTYLIDGSNPNNLSYEKFGLRVYDDTIIRFSGGSKIIEKANDSKTSHIFVLYGAKNVDIGGGHIVGDYDTHTITSGTTDEWCHGIDIRASKNVTVHDMLIEKCFGDGVYIGQPTPPLTFTVLNDYHCENVIVKDCVIDKCGRNGISLCDCEHWDLHNLIINNVNRTAPKAGIDVEPEGNNPPNVSSGCIANVQGTGSYELFLFTKVANDISCINITGGAVGAYDCTAKVFADNVHGNFIINDSEVIISNSFASGLYNNNSKLLKMNDSKIHWNRCAGNIEAHNCEFDQSFNYQYDVTAINCRFKRTAADSYLLRFAGSNATIINCVLDIAGDLTPIVDAVTDRLILKDCRIETSLASIPHPFIWSAVTPTPPTRVIDGNCYAPCTSLTNIPLEAGCVNFNY